MDGSLVELQAADGNRFAAFRADAPAPSGAGMIVLPDVRGLFRFYEELTLRFAEAGIDALAIDYYGRMAGPSRRGPDFHPGPQTPGTTWAGLRADAAAAAEALRGQRAAISLFCVGFCFGGRVSFLLATRPESALDGVIGFYGPPVGPSRNDLPAPAELAGDFRAPVLGLFGAADPSIPAEDVERFRSALGRAGMANRLLRYPEAPHSFFDRKQERFAETAAAAWDEVLAFVGGGARDLQRAAASGP